MELVFEIGCEELPASFLEPTLEQIKKGFIEACAEARISVNDAALRVIGTPRRLTLLVRELAEEQEDLEEERRGPPANIAFRDGEPTGAAKGFARGQGVEVADLYTVPTEKGEYLAAKIFERGRPTLEILPGILNELIAGLTFPKSMRWGDHTASFGRPVRWILAVADGKVVPVEFAGVTSSNRTRGHRFAAPDEVELASIDAYLEALKAAQVTLDPAARREAIRRLCDEEASKAGGRIVEDEELVVEVANLIEKAQAVTLGIDERYLELPREVLISSMRSHQRYFAVEEHDGSALRAACVVIYNTPVRDPAVVAEGNLKVLRARLDDARFFWEKDLQTPLSGYLERLEEVIWIGPLGSMRDRSTRLATLAGAIAQAMELGPEAKAHAERAGELSKADLLSHMVDEFPDLQGVMGREYALKAGEPEAVAVAVGEQYLPKSADDSLPQSAVGAALALAEKLDAIVGCFGVEMIPTSTSDPYGLRRAALGVLRILRERNATVGLRGLVESAIAAYPSSPSLFTTSAEEVVDQVLNFLTTRLHFMLVDEAPTDVVKAVLATGVEDIPSVYGRVEALDGLRAQPDFEPLALGFKRVVNILRKQADEMQLGTLQINQELFDDACEEALFEAYQAAQKKVDRALRAREWRSACDALIGLKEPVDRFFDSVMVMADDEALRDNRIAILAALRTLFMQVADISEIQT